MTIRYRKVIMSGTPVEIIKELTDLAFDEVANYRKYMRRVAKRCKQLHSVTLNVKDESEFLYGLAAVKEITIYVN